MQTENFDLSVKNAELQEKLVKLQERYAEMEVEKKSIKDLANQSQPNMEVEELQKKVNVLTKELDDRNKAMIKMKIEHKNKIKNMNKTLETLKGVSGTMARLAGGTRSNINALIVCYSNPPLLLCRNLLTTIKKLYFR